MDVKSPSKHAGLMIPYILIKRIYYRLSVTFPKIFLFFFVFMGSVFYLHANTYYVSNNGNDDHTGTSPSTPWRTIAKVNLTVLHPGDKVLFQANGTWRDILIINQSGTPENWIYFGRYGVGRNPRILGSNAIYNGWTTTGTSNVWQRAVTGYSNPRADGQNTGEIYFLQDDSASWGQYRTYSSNFSNLTTEFHWAYNGGTFYIYAPSDPNSRYDSIEVSQRLHCIGMRDGNAREYHEFNGIDLMFAFNRGFYAGYPASNARGQIFRNMRIGYIGIKGDIRGYGLHVWHSDMLVENCYFSDCGRRAISLNLYMRMSSGSERNISNIIIRNNVFKRGQHTTSLDLAMTPSNQGDVIQGVYFYNNYIDDSEIEMNMGDERSNQIFIQRGAGFIGDVYIVGNVFNLATARNILTEGTRDLCVWNNHIIGTNENEPGSVFGNTNFNFGTSVDYRNNILWNTSKDPQGTNYGNYAENNSTYLVKDYNIYWQEPEARGTYKQLIGFWNTTHGNGFYNASNWSTYLSRAERWDANSPLPSNPGFIDFARQNYQLSETSPAVNAGMVLSKMIYDFSVGDSLDILAYDIAGVPRNQRTFSIGAYEYIPNDPSAAEIISFQLPGAIKPATINNEENTVTVYFLNNENGYHFTPTILISPGASINPSSGVPRDFSNPLTYVVSSENKLNSKAWTVSVVFEQQITNNDEGFADMELLKVYPNPAREVINIQTLPSSRIVITNLLGKIVYDEFNHDILTTIYPDFPPGMYIVSIWNNNRILATGKFLINK